MDATLQGSPLGRNRRDMNWSIVDDEQAYFERGKIHTLDLYWGSDKSTPESTGRGNLKGDEFVDER